MILISNILVLFRAFHGRNPISDEKKSFSLSPLHPCTPAPLHTCDLRIPVATVVGMFAEGMKEQEILAAFPNLEIGDIQEALDYVKDSGELNC